MLKMLNPSEGPYSILNVRSSEVTKQVANNHNRYNNATVSTQMSWNYDPLRAGKHSITSQFPSCGTIAALSELFRGKNRPPSDE